VIEADGVDDAAAPDDGDWLDVIEADGVDEAPVDGDGDWLAVAEAEVDADAPGDSVCVGVSDWDRDADTRHSSKDSLRVAAPGLRICDSLERKA